MPVKQEVNSADRLQAGASKLCASVMDLQGLSTAAPLRDLELMQHIKVSACVPLPQTCSVEVHSHITQALGCRTLNQTSYKPTSSCHVRLCLQQLTASGNMTSSAQVDTVLCSWHGHCRPARGAKGPRVAGRSCWQLPRNTDRQPICTHSRPPVPQMGAAAHEFPAASGQLRLLGLWQLFPVLHLWASLQQSLVRTACGSCSCTTASGILCIAAYL